MFAFRAAPMDLEDRIDPEFFEPTLVAATRRIRDAAAKLGGLRSFSALRDPDAGICYGIVQPVFVEDGVPSVELSEMKAGTLDLPTRFVTERQHREYLRSEVRAGDILISVKGTLGVVAVVPSGFGRGNVNRDIARLRVRASAADQYYLVAYLSAPTGNADLCRIARGISPRSLNITDLVDHQVLLPQADAQRYIGSKVRQAEALRECARSAERAARDIYSTELNTRGSTDLPYRKTFRASLQERLDPEFYQPRYSGVLDAPWLVERAQPLGDLIVSGSYGCLPESGTYGTGAERLLRATDLDDCAWNSNAGVRVPTDQVAAKALVGEDHVLLEVKGAMTRCVVAHGHAVGCYVNGTVYRFKAAMDPWYLAVHLTGPIKQLYCARESVNNIILYLNLEAIRNLPVIRLGPDAESRIGANFKRSVLAAGAGRTLVTAARLLVEALIERKVTEAELIAAGKDADADRALLARLTEDGLDGVGAPLFSDLDSLAELLAEAQRGGGDS